MRVFVYEFVSACGELSTGQNAMPASLLAEGRAMLAAIATDFAALAQVEVDVLLGPECGWTPGAAIYTHRVSASQHAEAFDRLAANADWTVVVAPEIGGSLLDRCRRVIEVGGKLLGPGLELVALASDKHETAQWLAKTGLQVPAGVRLDQGSDWPLDFPCPAVLKPLDGAGSQDVRLFREPPPRSFRCPFPARLERYYPGTPASVAVLGGRGVRMILPPALQRLASDGSFAYLGGVLPLAAGLRERAHSLADRVARALPDWIGYIGLDIVLGGDWPGGDPREGRDFVIEINPRLTTSYVGLREVVEQNLAEVMLRAAEGADCEITCRPGRVCFDVSGKVDHLPA